MIKDRGKIKWVSMMLPEHVQMLREWAEEDANEERIFLDEQQVEEINHTIAEAMEHQLLVAISYYDQKRYHVMVGHIHYFDEWKRQLNIIDRFEEVHYIKLEDVMDVRFA
ncbi:YolD-like family protein [Bacillus sp. AGMB 02131]|uniref:YolD-like family protein n=1 Tax=Peribacillus faecalis TaxID=2772559 RepID=A0A927D114_9BACI|nr:YolD-like family protein [Peribacillus faecalis]MBD3109585.1 YolD-like family protein [Peribacillus faecalis]